MSMQFTNLTTHERDDYAIAERVMDSELMARTVPALFATTAHPKMSERYSFTNTYDIVVMLHNRGYRITSIQGGERKYNKVLVRMRPDGMGNKEYAPELVLLDSHDGSSRLKMFLGFIRFVCMNGCIAGDMLYARTYMHLAPDLMQQVQLDIEDVGESITKLNDNILSMSKYRTTGAEQIVLADAATTERFGDRNPTFIQDMRDKMLHRRRSDDKRDDMYTVMNVIQENAMRGGMLYRTSQTIRRMRDIRNVDRTVNINHTLWNTANELMQRRVAA
jgi:hypothetical protein